MWDFNLSYGNADYCDADLTTGWQYNFDLICDFTTSIPFWWKKLLQDPHYTNGLKCRWEELRAGPLHTDSINYFIDSVALHVQEARLRNFQRWPIIGQYVNWNGFVGQTYQEDVDYLKTYMEQRSIWIDNNLPGNCNLAVEEPEFVPEHHKVWPNPLVNEFNIGVSVFVPGNASIQITDVTGRILREEQLGNLGKGTHAFTLNNLNLVPGNYLYLFHVNNEVIYSGKVVKR